MSHKSVNHRLMESYNNLVQSSKALADLMTAPQIQADTRAFATVAAAHRSCVEARQAMLSLVARAATETGQGDAQREGDE